jgi:lipopolysaccharide/colanic/teichoic acid biosynthesis glycosyltransferase
LSLDEIPQLINVLKGEMSLVGPRPEMPFIVDTYESYEKKRLSVMPGITGLWQVSPARNAEIHDNPEYDLLYIEHRDLSLDILILILTIVFVFRSVTH